MNRITYRWVDGVRGREGREKGGRRKKTVCARESEAAPRRGWKGRDRRQQSTDRSCDTPLRHRRNNWLPHGEFEELSRVAGAPRSKPGGETIPRDGGIPGSAGGGGRARGIPPRPSGGRMIYTKHKVTSTAIGISL